MIGYYDPVVLGKSIYQGAKIKGPGGIAVDHQHRLAPAFIQVVIPQAVNGQIVGLEGIEGFI